MIPVGKYSELEIVRSTDNGLYLKDAFNEEVLLPNKYCPTKYTYGDKLKVFVYLDHEARKVATTLTPRILLNEFASLKVKSASDIGAFMDWGMEKDLLVPFREQAVPMEEGESYVVQLSLDHKTSRLYASSKIENRFEEGRPPFSPGQEVEVLVYRETELGYPVVVNSLYGGMVFRNEVFKPVKVGDQLKGFVKKVREDNKVDISLQPIGYTNFNDPNAEMVYQKLIESDGTLKLGDKSDAEDIYKTFGISKKAYKKAIGALYKQKKILIKPDGITLSRKK
ncbi:MAG: GntR family transcriptional regulator [Cyclobacteriaceae bacterium]|nr:GntR family transcriptional regulator [Cyclobacteriaceae bacterium SS2]